MTAKQILDAFSETLMQDERILSPRERELLISLLQNSRVVSNSNPETQSAVTATIARSVGETVAQRAFALLGGSIVEQILARSTIPAGTDEITPATMAERAPQPPGGAPRPPGVPQPPHTPQPPGKRRPPDRAPQPGDAPQPPGGRLRSLTVQQGAQQNYPDSGSGVGVLDAPGPVREQCVVLDEFLAPQELDELVDYALEHEAEFQNSEVISPSGELGAIDYNHRRSRVLMDLGKHEEVILGRIRCVLPRVLEQLGIEQFPVTHMEAQITASNNGDFFGAHSDDSHAIIASRRLTFVYFFHREPRQFAGGELLLHDSPGRGDRHVGTGSYRTIVPQQNQIVFFPCSRLHEITPVECPSRAFADSRFTLNGWLHK
jgi:Rps23 Pro-64 3,4-dihydroxylase Tpa1-like proline 4-hydroxylase